MHQITMRAVWAAFALATGPAPAPAPAPAVVSVCTAAVVTVWQDTPTPCDLVPPTRLDVAGIGPQSCANFGGEWVPAIRLCEGVDY